MNKIKNSSKKITFSLLLIKSFLDRCIKNSENMVKIIDKIIRVNLEHIKNHENNQEEQKEGNNYEDSAVNFAKNIYKMQIC